MDATAYAIEAQVEATHWWFVGRRRLLGQLISDLSMPADARVLDLGTSTGTNLRMLRELGFTKFGGLDSSEEAVRWCRDKGLGKVVHGDVCSLPFADSSFDLILATDVIEHVDDDLTALREVQRVLRPGATTIITVPAFQLLWGLQDEVGHHKRRYRGSEVLARLAQSGLSCQRSFYFNYLLFVPILAARQVILRLRIPLRNESELNNALINAALTRIFMVDVWSAPRLRPPFGASFLAVANRPMTDG